MDAYDRARLVLKHENVSTLTDAATLAAIYARYDRKLGETYKKLMDSYGDEEISLNEEMATLEALCQLLSNTIIRAMMNQQGYTEQYVNGMLVWTKQ